MGYTAVGSFCVVASVSSNQGCTAGQNGYCSVPVNWNITGSGAPLIAISAWNYQGWQSPQVYCGSSASGQAQLSIPTGTAYLTLQAVPNCQSSGSTLATGSVIGYAAPQPPTIQAPAGVTSGTTGGVWVVARSGSTYSWQVTGATITSPGGSAGTINAAGWNGIQFQAPTSGSQLGISVVEINPLGTQSAASTMSLPIDPAPETPSVQLQPYVMAGSTVTASVASRSGITHTCTVSQGGSVLGASSSGGTDSTNVSVTGAAGTQLVVSCTASNVLGVAGSAGSATASIVAACSAPTNGAFSFDPTTGRCTTTCPSSSYPKACGTTLCIPAAGCCSLADCPAAPTNATESCTSNVCGWSCNSPAYRQCGQSCIPTAAGNCCTTADCAQPTGGSATCSANVCSITCGPNLRVCGSACLPSTPGVCCSAADCGPSTGGATFACQNYSCQLAACAPGLTMCHGQCISNACCNLDD